MKPRTWIAALGLVAAAAGPVAAQSLSTQPLELTLAEARARALANNEALRIQREELVAAEAAIEGARGAYDPLLEVEARWREVTEPSNSTFSGAPDGALGTTNEGLEGAAAVRQLFKTGAVAELSTDVRRGTTDSEFALLSPAYETRLGLDLRQPLLRGRTLDPARLELRVAAADLDRSRAELQVEVEETVARVEEAYWLLVAARQGLVVREDAVRWATEQLEETGARIESGASPETEIAQPRAELERRRGELIEAQTNVVRAGNVLKLVLLSDEEDDLWLRPIVPVDELDVRPMELEPRAALAQALAARPEIEAERAALEARAAESEFRRDQVRPGLDAVASYSRFGLAGSPNAGGTPFGGPVITPAELDGELGRSYGVLRDGELDDLSVGLAFSLPVRNRAARAQAAIAESAERQAEADLALARKRVRVEVLDALALLEAAEQRLEAARAGVEAAQVQLDAEQERFAAGLSTNFLVLTRQNDLENARLVEIEARVDHLTARTALERSTGTLLGARGISLTEGSPAMDEGDAR